MDLWPEMTPQNGVRTGPGSSVGSVVAKMQEWEEGLLGGVGDALSLGPEPSAQKGREEGGGSPCAPRTLLCFNQAAL